MTVLHQAERSHRPQGGRSLQNLRQMRDALADPRSSGFILALPVIERLLESKWRAPPPDVRGERGLHIGGGWSFAFLVDSEHPLDERKAGHGLFISQWPNGLSLHLFHYGLIDRLHRVHDVSANCEFVFRPENDDAEMIIGTGDADRIKIRIGLREGREALFNTVLGARPANKPGY